MILPVAPTLFIGGHHLAAAVDVGRDRVGNADAADQQGGEADQGQELAQPLERACHLWRGIAPVATMKPASGRAALLRSRKRLQIAGARPAPVEHATA